MDKTYIREAAKSAMFLGAYDLLEKIKRERLLSSKQQRYLMDYMVANAKRDPLNSRPSQLQIALGQLKPDGRKTAESKAANRARMKARWASLKEKKELGAIV